MGSRPVRLTRRRARQIAIAAQLLDRRSSPGLVGTVEGLLRVQIDPTAPVARTEHLVLRARLGDRFRPAALVDATYRERSLFEYRAHVYSAADFSLIRPLMLSRRRWDEDTWSRRVGEWLVANAAFRDYVLEQLAERGPLRSREIEDRSAVPWRSSGWSGGRNVGQMLESLATGGEIAVSSREGSERLWDLPDRVYPPGEGLDPDIAARLHAERRLRAHGLVRRAAADGVGVPVEIEAVAGDWVADEEALERPFRGRTAILSPFDRLIYDRERTLALFGFEYRLEMYVPAALRRWGYYVLPVLRGDRLVARVDARADRAASVLRVIALHLEPGATEGDLDAARSELDRLAAWLRLDGVSVERIAR